MLSSNDIRQWDTQGYIIKNNIINSSILQQSVDFMNRKYYDKETAPSGFGSTNGELEFPTGKLIDWLTLDPNLISSIKQLLKTQDILLTQSDAWGKYGSSDTSPQKNTDQSREPSHVLNFKHVYPRRIRSEYRQHFRDTIYIFNIPSRCRTHDTSSYKRALASYFSK